MSVEGIPTSHADRYREILALVDVFCETHLNAEYKELSRKMAAAVCRKKGPALRGKASGWAAGIVYALGQVNFLTDPAQTPHMTSGQIAAGFGVSPATMMGKAKAIRDGLELMPLHPEWCLPSKLEDNPLVWMLKVNGFIMDIRSAPREAQEEAHRMGLIPYIPADRK